MANHTLLDAVNEILKRVSVIKGSAGLLTSLTDSARQHNIDVAVQVVSEGIDELYSSSHIELPGEGAESTIVLVNGQREYTLASNLVMLRWPLKDRVNNQTINKWKGSYEDFLEYDPQQTFTGQPFLAMISPITGSLRVERQPDASVNGRIYFYQYEKDLGLSLATDNVPFLNPCFRAMVPAWVQLYKREMRNEFDVALYQQAIGRASRYVTEVEPRRSWSPRRGSGGDAMPW